MIATALEVASEEQQSGGGTVALFPGSLLLKDMVTLVISLKVSFFLPFLWWE